MVAAKSRTTAASPFNKLNGQEQCLKKILQVSLKSVLLNILINTSWDKNFVGDTCGRCEKLMLDSDYT